MLPITLSNSLEELALNLQIPDKIRLKKFFERYYNNKSLKYIYVGALMRMLSIDLESSYVLLNKLVSEGFLMKSYEFRCPNDGRKKHFSEDYINLPIHIVCDECFEEFNLRDHLFIVYEVSYYV